jgi:transposase InsO family protein
MLKITRQAFYKNRKIDVSKKLEEEIIIQLVKNIRKTLPRLGGRKLYKLLKDDLSKLPSRLGRDKFFDLLRENGLLIEPVKQYVVTTNSHHRFRIYSNLVKGLNIKTTNELWVADITYIRLRGGFCYLFLVTDVYSRKIVGYDLNMGLATDGAVAAIKMGLKNITTAEGLIHHSDRGFQYCSQVYVELLKRHEIKISMGEAGNPYDNAIAERVNGILKTEFFLNAEFVDFATALRAVIEAINIYNNLRPHMSIGYMTPAEKYAA